VRLGCGGCLTTVFFGAVVVGCLLLGGWAVGRALSDPGIGPAPAFTREDGVRAQRKLLDVIRGPEGRTPRSGEITLSTQELNALASRHLDQVADLRLRDVSIQLDRGRIGLAARVPAGDLLRESALEPIAGVLPTAWVQHPISLRIDGSPRVESGARRRVLRLDLQRAWLGQQRLPPAVLRLLLGPDALGALRWSLPPHVVEVTAEPGRLVFRLGPEPPRSAAAARR
jgi:hypothetical protein